MLTRLGEIKYFKKRMQESILLFTPNHISVPIKHDMANGTNEWGKYFLCVMVRRRTHISWNGIWIRTECGSAKCNNTISFDNKCVERNLITWSAVRVFIWRRTTAKSAMENKRIKRKKFLWSMLCLTMEHRPISSHSVNRSNSFFSLSP